MAVISPILKIESLSKSFDGICALDNLSVEFEPGRITAIIGPNGSGKTTLFNLLTGFWKADRGQIWFGQHNVSSRSPHERARLGLGRTFQNIRLLPQVTVLDNVLIALKHSHSDHLWEAIFQSRAAKMQDEVNRARATELLSIAGLREKANSLGRELSHGQRRLLEFARVLALEPKLMLLDEPLAGLFPSMVDQVKQLMHDCKAAGKTILFIEHNVESVMDLSDRVVVLNQGRLIADGTPQEIQGNPTVVEAYLGRRYRESRTA